MSPESPAPREPGIQMTGALVRELLSNNSLFVGQLYEDKSLALHSELLLNNSLLELIYFLIKSLFLNFIM